MHSILPSLKVENCCSLANRTDWVGFICRYSQWFNYHFYNSLFCSFNPNARTIYDCFPSLPALKAEVKLAFA